MKPVLILRHVPEEALGNLEIVLRARGMTLEVVDCFAPTWPDFERAGLRQSRLAGLVVMGGTMHANQTDRFPFLATEVAWLREAVDAELPTLGICLGAQLLAKALGARVYANRVKEIGWYEIQWLSATLTDPLFTGGNPGDTVFQWHGDTFDLPAGAAHLARGASCEHQAFRYGRNAYGVQFHPEMTGPMVADWLVEESMCADLAGLDDIGPDEIRRRAPAALLATAPLIERLFGAFADLCRKRAACSTPQPEASWPLH